MDTRRKTGLAFVFREHAAEEQGAGAILPTPDQRGTVGAISLAVITAKDGAIWLTAKDGAIWLTKLTAKDGAIWLTAKCWRSLAHKAHKAHGKRRRNLAHGEMLEQSGSRSSRRKTARSGSQSSR